MTAGAPALPPAGADASAAKDIRFAPAFADDFERLLALRILVMRDHLERIGRFDPDRARARFAAGFVPASMKLIQVQDRFAGCVSLGADAGGLELAHFYLHPDFQNQGLGGAVLKMLLTGTDAAGATVRLAVLKHSPARRFYERHGFVWDREGEWDDFLLRRPAPAHSV